MSTRNTLLNALEDFSARVLAVEPSDSDRISGLKQDLEAICPSLEPESPSVDLLKLSLTVLQVVEESTQADARRLLNAVAVAAGAMVGDLSGEADGSEIDTAAECLKTILESQPPAPSVSPAEPPCENNTSAEHTVMSSSSSFLDSDPELLQDFIAESCDRIAAAEAALLTLESNPNDTEQVDTILRAFHTVKGASGFLGLDKIQELAHSAENLLIRARSGQIRMAGEHADLALQSCDALRTMVTNLDPEIEVQECFDTAMLSDLIKNLSVTEDRQASSDHSTGESKTGRNAAPDGQSTEPVESAGSNASPYSQVSSPPAAHTSVDTGVRVNAERLDELVNMVGELMIAHSISAQSLAESSETNRQLTRSVSHTGKILRSLQDLTLGLRMVPLQATFGKMARLVRDLARKSDKTVRLITSGEHTEIDRTMVEVLSDPLVHLIRNAVDHGIEPSDQRIQQGKDPVGTIHLRAYHSAGNVVIELQDDGRGLNRQRILAKAAERGAIEPDRELSDTELHSLIFLPGLSTAEQVTDVSGRGVGMDVVKKNIEELLRGKIEVRADEGKGSTFTLRLPLTLAIADAMLLRVGNERFLLPTISIEHSFRPQTGMVSTLTGRGEMVMARGQLLPVFRLHKLFGIDGSVAQPEQALLIVIEGGGKRCAVMVDEILGQQQVVIKSLGKIFANVPGVSGGAILGNGQVGLILDAAGLLQLARAPVNGQRVAI